MPKMEFSVRTGGAKTPVALAANVAAVFLRMHADVACSDLSPGRTVEVRTKCGFWGQRRFVFLTRHKENRRLTSDFFSKSYQTTVKCRATGLRRAGFFVVHFLSIVPPLAHLFERFRSPRH